MKNKFFTMVVISGCIVMGSPIKGYAMAVTVGETQVEVNDAGDARALYSAIQNYLLTTRNANETAQIYAQAYIMCLNQFGPDAVLEWNLPGMGGKIEDSVRYGRSAGRREWGYLESSITSYLSGILRGVLPILQTRAAALGRALDAE
ncbi:MAG: hypothetical protein LBD40_01875 [Puniceicoccales bacterium]|jgi:hypothetical protein|nr:hypothetical protein [Puniceicoccales bacterium]